MSREADLSYPPEVLAPAAWDPRVHRVFEWLTRRMFRSKFAGVHLAHGSRAVLESLAEPRDPVIVCMNHAGWWDPLLGVLVWRSFFPGRTGRSPIELKQFHAFKIFSKLGLFGIAPEDPRAADAFSRYVSEHFARDERPTLFLTPQGRFSDVREPVRVRPGVAAVAARHAGCRVVSIAAEYAFWTEQKPEVFVRARPIEAPASTTTAGWLRAMTRGMQANQDELAELVIAKDAAPFEDLIGARSSGVHPLYNLVVRLRGHDPKIEARREGMRDRERTTA